MPLDGTIVDNLFFYPFLVIVAFVRAKESIYPGIFDYVVMHELSKGDLFEFAGLGHTKDWIMLCDSRQDWF